jgi:hypothetical protein
MTELTRLLLILLSHQGYWVGGQDNTVRLEWAVPAHAVDAVVEWRLMAGSVQLAKNRASMPADEAAAEIRITPPDVRVRTALRWHYRLLRRDDGSEMERGVRTLHVFPVDLLAGAKKELAGKRVLVVDREGELTNMLSISGIVHERALSLRDVHFARPDILLIAPDQIGDDRFEHAPLLGHAGAGASVGVFPQPRAVELAGYPLARRALPKAFEWRTAHPLLIGLEIPDLQSVIESQSPAAAIRLPADEPALEIAWWPREVPGDEPVPIDALLISKSIGRGRLVLCQVPLDSWKTDPRSQQFLANLLGYLATRPEPTPSPSHREVVIPVATAPVPTITIPSGGVP